MPRINPNESLGFHCNMTFKAFMRALENKLKDTGVSRAQFLALEHLIAYGPLCLSELVDRLLVTPATGARLVDRMERDGWVIREVSPRDARVKQVVVTPSITKIWAEVSQSARDILDQAYDGIDPNEIEMVKRILEKVRKNLEIK